MTDTELLAAQQTVIKNLQKQVKRLRKRLIEKMGYEKEMLVQSGWTPQLIEKVRRKDEAALKED